jgi:hypothetical protein
MKIVYALAVFVATAASAAFISLNPTDVAAENNKNLFVGQEQINQLVDIALPPYKQQF